MGKLHNLNLKLLLGQTGIYVAINLPFGIENSVT